MRIVFSGKAIRIASPCPTLIYLMVTSAGSFSSFGTEGTTGAGVGVVTSCFVGSGEGLCMGAGCANAALR